ncbi:hypothetical protein C8R46DRAFT_1302834 [Mycena filopes]|nr:hypothetical protein C8R46DRAFT_1302834 [Mycena filopes]
MESFLTFILPLALLVSASLWFHHADQAQTPPQTPPEELPELRQKKSAKMHCRHCGENLGTLVCTGCRNVSYCSNECQVVSWKQGHKELCRGRTTTRHLTPIPPLNPPPVRMSPAEERAARKKKSWGLASQCAMTLHSRYVDSYDYYALPNPPVLWVVVC